MRRYQLYRLGIIFSDLALWLIAAVAIYLLRYDAHMPSQIYSNVGVYVGFSLLGMFIFGMLLKVYRFGWKLGSWEEMVSIAIQILGSAVLATSITLLVFGLKGSPLVFYLTIPPLAFANILFLRAIMRLVSTPRWSGSADAKRVLVYGCGTAGRDLVRLTHFDQRSPHRVVAFLDDDRMNRNFSFMGVKVAGTRHELSKVAHQFQASTLIVAIYDLEQDILQEVFANALDNGLEVYRLPPLTHFLDRHHAITSIQKITATDLLGRDDLTTNLLERAKYINGKRVLITGAGGSIGSEIARQVSKLGPSEIALLDRDESALHEVQLSIYGRALLDTRDMVLCDIRDEDALRRVFKEHRPQIVFHTAALKHLPMLESYPEEGWKTNVLGTLNLLQLADEFEVETFVNISTDKAANPTSVLGRTKRIAERLTAAKNTSATGRYVSVRFGNVLDSRGSVLRSIRYQIQHGGPVTITHPDVNRYFMTIPEACSLVIEAGAIGHRGEVMILDMGSPVMINDLAQRLITESRQAVQIVYTGLRHGEKLSEELVAEDEQAQHRENAAILHVPIPPLEVSELESQRDWTLTGKSSVTGSVDPRS